MTMMIKTREELFDLARQGDVEALHAHLHNTQITEADEAGWTILHIAASTGNLPLLRLLLSPGDHTAAPFPTANLGTTQGTTPLHYAASKGHLESTLFLLSLPQVQLAADAHGATAMHRSAAANRPQILAELLAVFPRDVDRRDADGNTALHVAVQEAAVRCVRVLVEAGARKDMINADGKLARDYVVRGNDDLLGIL